MDGSRLSCVQQAIKNQLDELQKEKPHVRIGLIGFNSGVTFFGDGSETAGIPILSFSLFTDSMQWF